MANPFASSKQSSLFPSTFPSVRISKDEYHLFYSYERALFETLVALFYLEVNEATLVIGFLLWLEREGYTSYALGKRFINYFTFGVINEVVDEVLTCIKLLQKKARRKICNISKLQSFLDQKLIHLDELYDYGDLIYDEVCRIASDISEKAFDDMLHHFRNEVTPPDQRTIFLTFSKGYPLSADEVREYFTGKFGDFIESIHMQPVEQGSQPIYARMVVRDPSWITTVTKGGCRRGKTDYVINAKHVRARKFVPRKR